MNDISSLYTNNAGMYTATIQVALKEGHTGSSFEYMDRVRDEMAAKFPDVRTFFQNRLHAGRDSQSGSTRSH